MLITYKMACKCVVFRLLGSCECNAHLSNVDGSACLLFTLFSLMFMFFFLTFSTDFIRYFRNLPQIIFRLCWSKAFQYQMFTCNASMNSTLGHRQNLSLFQQCFGELTQNLYTCLEHNVLKIAKQFVPPIGQKSYSL